MKITPNLIRITLFVCLTFALDIPEAASRSCSKDSDCAGKLGTDYHICVEGECIPGACDPDFMQTLRDRAWMQAQREIEINKRIISKPDSVLKLTCFDQLLNHAASTTSIYNDRERLENALTSAVSGFVTGGAGESGHINNGFQYNLKGGHLGTEAELESEVEAGSYGTCKAMETVWRFVLSKNIGFELTGMTFKNYTEAEKDFREYPEDLRPDAVPPDDYDGWNRLYNRMVTRQVAEGNEDYFDIVELFRDKWAPEDEVGCSEGIPTGVKVITTSSEDPDDEKVCPNPGCYFDTDGETCTPISDSE